MATNNSVTISAAGAVDMVYSPDGEYLFITSGGSVTAYSTATGASSISWAVGTDLGAIDVSTDGRYLFMVERASGPTSGDQWSRQTDYYVYRLDTFTGTKTTFTAHATGYDGAFADLAVLANGSVLLTQNFLGSGWEPLTTLDPATGTFTRGNQTYAQDGTLNSNPDDRFVVFTPQNISDAPIFFYVSGVGVTASHSGYADNVMGYNSGIQAISPDGQIIAEGVGFNIYNSNLQLRLSLSTLYPELGGTRGLAFSADGSLLYTVAAKELGIIAISTSDWSLVGQWDYNISASTNRFGNALVSSPDGDQLALFGSSGPELISLAATTSSGGTSGNDVLSYAGSVALYGFAGNDTLTITAGAQAVRAGSGNDRIVLTSTSAGVYGTSIIDGGAGDDVLDVSQLAGAQFTSDGSGIRVTAGRVFTVTGVEHVQLGSGNDTVALAMADDATVELLGGAGNDTLQGGVSMVLRGEAGNDVFQLGVGSSGATLGIVDGGIGVDRIQVSASFVVDLGAGSASNGTTSYALAGIEDVTVTVAGGNAHVTGDANANVLMASAFLDTGANGVVFDGAAGNDTLNGSKGNDHLSGGDGHDAIAGSAGADTIDGGSGIDVAIYTVARTAAGVTQNANGSLTVSVSGTDIDTLSSVEQLQFVDGLYSFQFAQPGNVLIANFAAGAGGWSSQDRSPRHVADVNGDGYNDIVGFDQSGVLVSFGSANGSFSNASLVVSNFGQNAGWSSDNSFHRELADVNGDGRDDIIGFGTAGTLVSLAKAGGTYDNPVAGLADFGTNQGWASQDGFARTTGDVNGDGKADLIGFGRAGTLISLGNGDGSFGTAALTVTNFGVDQGWTSDNLFHRVVADVNGDGKDDLIGFGAANTWVALSNGDGTFGSAQAVLDNFGRNQGWASQDGFVRDVQDLNGDGYADIVGFGSSGTFVAFGRADGTFSAASIDVDNFSAKQGWTSDATFHRELADIDNDGLADIVGFGFTGVFAGLNQGHDWLF